MPNDLDAQLNRQNRLDGAIRSTWGWLGASLVVLCVAAAVGSLDASASNHRAASLVTVGLELIGTALAVVGLLRAPIDPSFVRSPFRHLLDVAIMITVAGSLAWLSVLELVPPGGGVTPDRLVALVGTAAAALLIGASMWAADRVDQGLARAVRLAALGALLIGIEAMVQVWRLAYGVSGRSSALAGTVLVGALLITAGGLLGSDAQLAGDRKRQIDGMLTLVAPAAAGLALVIGALRELGHASFADVTFWMVIAVMLLSIVRQVVTLIENDRLNLSLRSSADALRHQASHDDLTGALNRRTIVDRLTELRQLGARSGGVGVFFLDVDHFKEINDSLGHDRGDTLLVEFAERLRAVIGDDGDIARFGGDEFLVTTTADNVDELVGFGSRLRSALSAPMAVGGVEIIVTTSIGAAFAPDGDPHPVTNDELLRDADLALHEAKRNGRDCLVMFTPELLAREGYRVALAGDLRKARTNHEIEPYYQPIIDLLDGTICGAEALIRWNHPFEGVILPDRWLTVAEETGLLVGIGRATMEESCRRFAAINGHRRLTPVRVAVNLSATEVRSPGLVAHVAQVLSTSGLSPAQLIFEVSEQIVGDALTVAVLEELHALGVRLSIDDFGTGYASMRQLKRFPVDEIKIDQSFVAGLGIDPADTTIVRTIVELGTGLGLDVVAEGVTTESQAEQLAALGCRYAQGWLYGRAQPFSRFVGLISRMDQERDDAGRDSSRASGADTFGADERLGA